MNARIKRNEINKQLASIWTEIVELLNLRQLDACMGDGYSDYKAKAIKVKKVSQSGEVHRLADELICTYDTHLVMRPLDVSNQDFSDFE